MITLANNFYLVAIGVGFSGITSQSAQGSITFLQPKGLEQHLASTVSNEHSQEANESILNLSVEVPSSTFVSRSTLIEGDDWMSWLDHNFWDDLDVPIEA